MKTHFVFTIITAASFHYLPTIEEIDLRTWKLRKNLFSLECMLLLLLDVETVLDVM